VNTDVYCENTSVKDSLFCIFNEKEVYRNDIIHYSYNGNFLGITLLPFDPVDSKNYNCTQKIAGRFCVETINQDGAEQIMFIIINSIKRAPSKWINSINFDTTFQSYCSVFSTSMFPMLGISLSEWLVTYTSVELDDAQLLLIKNAKGMLINYYAHNHLVQQSYEGSRYRKRIEETQKILVSQDAILYQTAHGVLLRKNQFYKWVYFEDNVYKLRFPSISKVVVSNGQINIFIRKDYSNESQKKSLSFSLDELLK
jgi:hypothetical protein